MTQSFARGSGRTSPIFLLLSKGCAHWPKRADKKGLPKKLVPGDHSVLEDKLQRQLDNSRSIGLRADDSKIPRAVYVGCGCSEHNSIKDVKHLCPEFQEL